MPDPTVLIDRYEVHGLLGAGGSARVHVGHDRVLDRRVAIKLLDADVAASADPAGHARFVREAQSAAGFSHTHAVATFDAGQDDHQLFIVMEYVDGLSLAQRIADDAPFDEGEIVRIGTQLLSALGAAHEAGIVHRDVKPANVLIDHSGDVKLTDFGIAQRFDEITQALTVEGMVMGTRGYLAPERARGLDGGPQADLFAVGAVLFEMATGRRSPAATHDSVVGADPRTTRPDLSPTIATAIMTALAGRPEHRFSSAADMTLSLRGHLPPTQLDVAEPPPAAVPAAAAAVPPGPSARPTEIMGVTGSRATPETALMPTATPPPAQRSGSGLLIAALVLIAVAGGLIALARNDRAPDAAPAGTSAVSEVSSAPSAPATTVAPNTAPPSTPPPTTVAPTMPPTTVVAELIPGFPATDDIDQFIEQLRGAKDTAGKQARKLSDELRDLVKSDGDKIDEKADDIADKIEEWVDEDELDPTVAERALQFVDELARG